MAAPLGLVGQACWPAAQAHAARGGATTGRPQRGSRGAAVRAPAPLTEAQPAVGIAQGPWLAAAPPPLATPGSRAQPFEQPRQQPQQHHARPQRRQQRHQPWAPGAVAGAGQQRAAAPAALPPQPPVARLGVHLNEAPQPLPPPPPQPQPGGGGDGDRDRDFFANVGDAIRTLREDYPLLLAKDLNYAIYREDLVFSDPSLTFRGLKNYRLIVWSLRFHARLLLKAAHVQVLRIWQPDDHVIKLRWQINATPRLGSPGTFDGISVYRLDRGGRVYQHEITDVQMRDPPITNPLLYGLNFLLSPRPQIQQMPCPGGYFVDPEQDGDLLVTAPARLSGCGQQ